MDQKIDKVIRGHVLPAEPVVQSKGEIGDRSQPEAVIAGKPLLARDAEEVPYFADVGFFEDVMEIIKLEGRGKGVGIGDQADRCDQHCGEQGP